LQMILPAAMKPRITKISERPPRRGQKGVCDWVTKTPNNFQVWGKQQLMWLKSAVGCFVFCFWVCFLFGFGFLCFSLIFLFFLVLFFVGGCVCGVFLGLFFFAPPPPPPPSSALRTQQYRLISGRVRRRHHLPTHEADMAWLKREKAQGGLLFILTRKKGSVVGRPYLNHRTAHKRTENRPPFTLLPRQGSKKKLAREKKIRKKKKFRSYGVDQALPEELRQIRRISALGVSPKGFKRRGDPRKFKCWTSASFKKKSNDKIGKFFFREKGKRNTKKKA